MYILYIHSLRGVVSDDRVYLKTRTSPLRADIRHILLTTPLR